MSSHTLLLRKASTQDLQCLVPKNALSLSARWTFTHAPLTGTHSKVQIDRQNPATEDQIDVTQVNRIVADLTMTPWNNASNLDSIDTFWSSGTTYTLDLQRNLPPKTMTALAVNSSSLRRAKLPPMEQFKEKTTALICKPSDHNLLGLLRFKLKFT